MRRPHPIRTIKRLARKVSRAAVAMVRHTGSAFAALATPAAARISAAFVAAILIFVGLHAVYPPAAYVVVGGLIWLDLALDSHRMEGRKHE